MTKKTYTIGKPDNVDKYINLSQDKSDYKSRLEAIEFLSQYKCYECKKELYRLMKTDKIFEVKEAAFRALQNWGEPVKLYKKKKGKTIKSINDKLLVIHNSFNGDSYELTDFKARLKGTYPEVYDVYSYEKRNKFDTFLLNSIKTFPKTKIEHNYSIKIEFDKTIDIQPRNFIINDQRKTHDVIILDKNSILINCNREAKINLHNIIFNETNIIHNLIIKSLIFYYIDIATSNFIKQISILRFKPNGENILYSIPNRNISIEQILTNHYNGLGIEVNNIEDIFDVGEKGKTLQLALTYLLKSKISLEPSVRFGKLWQSLNAIYKYMGNGQNENSSQIFIRKFIIDNCSFFPNSTNIAKHISYNDLKHKIRFAELLRNDYDTREKIVSYISFIYRHTNDAICRNILDNISYFESTLKNILTINQIEAKFNKDANIKNIYQTHKNSHDNEAIFKTVIEYLKSKAKLQTLNSEIEIVTFICLKYSYYLRNKIFHAEKNDLTFRFAKNNLIFEIDWINNLMETLIVELISINKQWIRFI